jgi:O-antigen/teichoic acid export membrane protein
VSQSPLNETFNVPLDAGKASVVGDVADSVVGNTAPHGPHHAAHGAALARGAFFNTLAFLASNLRGIFIFLIARLLGSAALGTFGLAWAATDVVSKIATLGFDTTATAFVAQSDPATGRWLMRFMLVTSMAVSLLIALAALPLAIVLGPALGLRPELARAAGVLMLALPGITLYRVSTALSRGRGAMHHDIYTRGFTESLGTAAALLVALAAGAGSLAPEVAAIIGTGASGIVAYGLARRLFPPVSHVSETTVAGPTAGVLIRHSAPVALYTLLNIAIMQIDVVMLGMYVGRAPNVTLETLGIYAGAVGVAGGLRKVNQAFTPIFTPFVAAQMGRGAIREAEITYGYLARWMLAILLPAVVVLALSGDAIMRIFGPGFPVGGPWVAIVGAACALNAFVGLGELVLMVKRPSLNLLNSAIAISATIGLNVILIPSLGPLGAAIGMLVPYALQGILRGAEISWLFKWRWPFAAMVKPWIAAGVALVPGLVVRILTSSLAGHLAASVVYLMAYLVMWRVIGLDASDRAVFSQLRRRPDAGSSATI